MDFISFLGSLRRHRIPVFALRHVTMAPYLFLVGVTLLILVLIPGIGHEVNGSRRWLPLFIINLQPSELIKLFSTSMRLITQCAKD